MAFVNFVFSVASCFANLAGFAFGTQQPSAPTALGATALGPAAQREDPRGRLTTRHYDTQDLLAGITGTLLLCAMAAMLLALQRHLERLTQTLTALAGSLALLDLIALPITSWWQQVHDSGVANPLPALLLLAVLGWNLGVVGHVLRHALGIAWFMGIAIALAFYLLFMDVMNTLFPFNG